MTEKSLKEELTKKGVSSLKQVSCPSEGAFAGRSFTCTGIFESGVGFSIPVQHQIEGDQLKAEIPSIKGMLNMEQVMKQIRDELKLGDRGLDCSISTTYRMVTPGSTFECALATEISALPTPTASPQADGKADKAKATEPKPNQPGKPDKPAAAPKEPGKIEIAIAASGDVTWQRLIASAKPLNGSGSPISDAAKSDPTKSDPAKSDPVQDNGAKASPQKPGDQNSLPSEAKPASPSGGSAKESDEVEYDS